jgi:Tfp pilus assembly major pilin PilA
VPPDCPVCHAEQWLQRQRSSAKGEQCTTVRGQRAQSQSRRQKAHRTVNSNCLVHHRTVRWSHLSELQRSNPNGWVTWLAHRTVSSGAPDCLVRPSTDSLPNGILVVGAINTLPTTTLQGIQVFRHHIQYKSSRLHSKTQKQRLNPLQVPNTF